MDTKTFETPVLLLIFNRPHETAQVFEAVKKRKPKKLFIAADGARSEKPGEKEICLQVRTIATQVDWPCEVHTLFREKNLGCKIAVSSAIDWFFEHVEEGIILEDDCVPNEAFFTFCRDMLEYYRTEKRVGMIAGTNFLPFPDNDPGTDYFFVRSPYIWGWATWRRAWQQYDLSMRDWPNLKKQRWPFSLFKNRNVAIFFSDYFDMAYDGRANTWDIQWIYSCLKADQLCCVPYQNLIRNIGIQGTHSKTETKFNNMPTRELPFDTIRHPTVIQFNKEKEDQIFDILDNSRFHVNRLIIKTLEFLGLKNIVKRFYLKFKKMVK